MKKMKRFTALLVAFAVVAASGIFSVSVFAGDAVVTDKSSAAIEITEADMLLVEKLEAFGIVKDIEADLTANITRREMAELITDYMRIPDASNDYEVTPFVDVSVSDSSIGSIMALYNMQIITGDDTMRFYPDAKLNYDEALVFVVNAIGYKLFAAKDGGFPTGYHRVAIKLGMLKGLAMQSGRDEITRLDVYKLMEAGLRAAAITYGVYTEDENQYTVSATDDFLSDTHGITTHKGIITGNEDTYLTNATSKMTDEQIEIDNVLYDTPGYIYATSLGRSVIYYLRDDNHGGKEIAYIEENDALNNVIKIDSRDIVVGKTTNSRIYYTDEENKEYHVDFSDAVDVIYNGRVYRGYGYIANVLPAAGYIEALDNNGDDIADILFVCEYRNVLVNGIDTFKQELISNSGERIFCDVDSGNARIYLVPEMLKGSVKIVDVGSVASVMESKGTPKLTTIYVSEEKVNGTISEVLSDGTIIIDGVKYTKAVDYTGIALVAGATVSLSVDYNGYIAYGEYGVGVDTYEIGVLAAIDYEQSNSVNKIQMKIYTKAKAFATAELSNPVRINDVRYDLTKPVEMENALKILSENQTENGRYSVTEARIISYKLDGDKISQIDTGTSGNPATLQVLENRASNVLCRPAPQVFTITKENGNKIHGVYDTSKISVFAAPYNDPATPENELLQEAGYAYGLKLEEREYTTKTGVYYVYTKNTALYNLVNNEGINNISALLFRGSAKVASIQSGIDDESPFYLISKVSTALDKDGVSCKKLYFGEESKLLADTVTVIDITGQHTNLSASDPLVDGLKPGYVLQYGTDSNGKINSVRVISDFDETTGTVTHQYNYTDFPRGVKSVAGAIIENSPEANSVTISAWNPLEGTYLGRINGTIYIYHSAEDKLVQATQSELRVGDKITAHIKFYHNLTEIFVIR